MSHLPLDARAILHYLNDLGYRNISAEQLKEFLKGMQPKSNNNASKRQYSQQQQLPELTATSTTTNSLPQRTPVKVIKSKKPLCQFKFYLDICDHQLTQRIEDQIKALGGVLEFFLNASVTHFITDKTQTVSTKHQYINNNSQPGTPQTPATPGTPQTPYSLEANDATPVGIKRTRTSRADAILNRARRQSTTASVLTRTSAHARELTPVKSTFTSDPNLAYIVWRTEDALRFFKKVQFELRQYLESPKDRHKINITTNNNNKNNSSLKTKLVEPIYLKGNFIKIEPLKRNYRPYYQLFKKPIEWPKIELKRDDGAFRLSPKKQIEEQTRLDPPKMTRKSRSRSSQHRPLPATVQALKKHTIEGSPKASAGIQRNSKLNACKEVKESSDKQCGVCEICKIEYDTLSIHLKSKDHEYFAKNAQNFIALDSLINASADVNKFLEENKKMELEEIEVDEETNTEASALDPLNNPTPTMGLVEEKRRSSGAYKTPSPTLREKSKRITKGKHSSVKFQKTDFTATTTAVVTTKSTRTSPTKPTVTTSRSPDKKQTSSILELQSFESRKTITYVNHAITRKKPSSALALSPPIRPMMLPQSPLYKVVETSEMRTPKRKIRLGADEDAHVVDSPSLIVKFQKVRLTELERLNGEAESFMFRKQAISSELPTDQDRQTTSDTARVSISSISLDSTSESIDVDIENLEKPLGQKAIAKAKRRKVSVTKSKRSFPNAPIQPDIQLNTKTASTKRLSNIAATATASTTNTTATGRTTSNTTTSTAVNCFSFPEATRKSSRTATAIVTAATTSSLLQAAVEAARHSNSRRRAGNLLTKNAEQLPFALETSKESKTNSLDQQKQLAIRTRRTVVKLEDRVGEAPIITSIKPTTTPNNTTNPRIKDKMESRIPKTNTMRPTIPPELSRAPLDDLNMLDFEVFDDDEDIDNDDVNDEDFKVRKRHRKPSLKATNISSSRRSAKSARRRRVCETVIKQEQLTEVETEEEDDNDELNAENSEYEGGVERDDMMKCKEQKEVIEHEESKPFIGNIPEVIKIKAATTKRRRRRKPGAGMGRRRRRRPVKKLVVFPPKDEVEKSEVEIPEELEILEEVELPEVEAEPVVRRCDSETNIAEDKRLKSTPEKIKKSKIAKEQKSSPEKVKSKLDASSSTPAYLFDYKQSEHINNLQYAFERLPIADHWYRVFARQDACEEKYFEYFGSTKYRKLPYELGPIPFDATLKGTCCKLCSTTTTTTTETKPNGGTKLKTDILNNDDVTNGSMTTQHNNEVSTSSNAYLHKHKKLHLLQRYRKEQQDLLLQEQQQQQQQQHQHQHHQQQKQDKATQVEKIEGVQFEINPAAVGTTATTTGVSAATFTANKINSKASTPDFENANELPRNRAGSTHSTASSCASSSATLNKKPFRNKHLNKAAFLSLELPPRKSPREHASTLALVSCIIKQRQDSLSKNNSESDEPPITPTTPILPTIKQEEDSSKTNGEVFVEAPDEEEDKEQLLLKQQYEVQTKDEQETEQQAALVAEREKTPPLQLQPQQPPTVSESASGMCSPRTTRSTAATPIEEMRFATEISETVKRMRRGQNKYDHSPPFNTTIMPAQVANSSIPKTTETTIAQPITQITPRKRGRPPKDKSAVVAKLAKSILPYKRRDVNGLPMHLYERSSSNRSNTPNSNRSSMHRPTFRRRGRPSLLQKLAFNNTHSNYGLSPAIRKTGSKKGVLEFEVDTSALKALEIATQHTNVSHLEWEIDKYLQLSCKDYDVNMDIANITTASSIDVDEDVEESVIKPSTAAVTVAQRATQTPPVVQTPPPTDYFSSDFDLCDLLGTSSQFAGACAAYSAQPEGKRRAYSVYSAVAFENYFRKRRSNKKNRTGWPSTQRKRVATRDRDQRKTNFLAAMEQAAQMGKEETLDASKSVTERESGVMTPPDSEVDEHESAKTTASLENAEDYEGADSTEMDVAESVQDEEDDDANIDAGASACLDADGEEEEEVYADAEGEAEDDDEADEDADVDAETNVDFLEDTCSQDNADVGIEADEEDTENDDDDAEDVMTIDNDNDNANANANDDEVDVDDAEEDLDQESQNNDDNDSNDDAEEEEEEECEEAAVDADEIEEMDDDEDEDADEDADDEDQMVANAIFHKTTIPKAKIASLETRTTISAKRTRRNTSAAISPQKLNNANLLTLPNSHNNITSTPTNHLLRALRRTPQLNGSLGSCISPSEKAGDNSDIFTVSSDGLDTDLDLSNQHAQLKSVADDEQTTNEQQQCPHHGTPKRKLDITKYAPKNAASTCAAEAATAAVKSLAISQFLKKEVRVTCRRIRAPFRRFRFRR